MKITVLSPHRDDAAFSLSLSILTWLNAGHEIRVLNCFTNSEYAPFAHLSPRISGERSMRIADLRRLEDERWSTEFGSTIQIEDLKLRDAPIRLRCSPDLVCSVPFLSDDPAQEIISEAITRAHYDALVLPMALGNHVDHVTAMKASVPLSSSCPYALYEDLPYATRPGIFEDISSIASNIGMDLKPSFPSLRAKDMEKALKLKKALALCYDSQIGDAEATEIAEYSRQFHGRERLWANAAWREAGSGLSSIPEDACQ